MTSTSEQLAWLERVYTEDTMLALELLCVTGGDWPEIVAMQRALMRVQLLVSIHRLRLLGVAVTHQAPLWVLSLPSPHGLD